MTISNDMRKLMTLCEARVPLDFDKLYGKEYQQIIDAMKALNEGMLCEADNPATYWTLKNIEYWTRFTNSLIFKTPQEARDWLFRRLEHGDRQSHASLFGINGTEVNRAIADQAPVFRGKNDDPRGSPSSGYKIGGKPRISTKRVPRLGMVDPEGSAPSVDWSSPDLQDTSSRVTEQTILRDYVAEKDRAKVTIYAAYVPASDVPNARLVELEDEEDDDGGGYDWSEFSPRGVFPPLKLKVERDGKVIILDGNHRTHYWGEVGFDYYPAWVIDYRRVLPR
jgi:hypothetical protein